jgi:membrane associated rhomboid family serine protease
MEETRRLDNGFRMPLAPESSTAATDPRDPEPLIEVGVYASTREGFEHGLVALALGLPFWLVPVDGGARLMVEPDAAERVREQLRWFDEENARGRMPPAITPPAVRRADFVTPLLWALGVMASFRLQAESARWSEAGALDAAALFGRGEWWRPFTALFLHADLGHLVSNLLSGVFVFSAVLSAFGRARGWLLLVIGAVAGNIAAAAIRSGEAYRSVGASTAVFAALGLLTGAAMRRVAGHAPRGRWRAVFTPLASGLVVLGLFGAGEVRIDVVAHATGFACGLALGLGVRDRGAGA